MFECTCTGNETCSLCPDPWWLDVKHEGVIVVVEDGATFVVPNA